MRAWAGGVPELEIGNAVVVYTSYLTALNGIIIVFPIVSAVVAQVITRQRYIEKTTGCDYAAASIVDEIYNFRGVRRTNHQWR